MWHDHCWGIDRVCEVVEKYEFWSCVVKFVSFSIDLYELVVAPKVRIFTETLEIRTFCLWWSLVSRCCCVGWNGGCHHTFLAVFWNAISCFGMLSGKNFSRHVGNSYFLESTVGFGSWWWLMGIVHEFHFYWTCNWLIMLWCYHSVSIDIFYEFGTGHWILDDFIECQKRCVWSRPNLVFIVNAIWLPFLECYHVKWPNVVSRMESTNFHRVMKNSYLLGALCRSCSNDKFFIVWAVLFVSMIGKMRKVRIWRVSFPICISCTIPNPNICHVVGLWNSGWNCLCHCHVLCTRMKKYEFLYADRKIVLCIAHVLVMHVSMDEWMVAMACWSILLIVSHVICVALIRIRIFVSGTCFWLVEVVCVGWIWMDCGWFDTRW